MRILQLRPIQCNTIDDTENWSLFPFSSNEQLDQLRESIRTSGIHHPPILQQTEKNSYKIINGRKRVQIAQEQNWDPLHCYILDKDLPIQQVLTTHLTEQQLSNPLSVIEQAYFLQLCLQFIDKKDVLITFLPLLGYSSGEMILNRLLRFLHLENRLQPLLHRQFINEKTASILLELNQDDRIHLGNLFIDLKLGQGKQRRFLTLCRDLSRRHNTSIETILSGTEFKRILQHSGMNIPQKTNQLLDLLQKQHSPKYYSAKEDFQIQRKQLDLPEHCTLDHSPAFEKDEVTLSIKFADIAKCEKTWKTIRDIISG